MTDQIASNNPSTAKTPAQPNFTNDLLTAKQALTSRVKVAIFLISGCIILPCLVFFVLVGLPSWITFLNPPINSAENTKFFTLFFAIFATLPLVSVTIFQILYWRRFRRLIKEYLNAIGALGWKIDVNQTALVRAVPFSKSDYTFATIFGLTETNHQPNPLQIFHFQEQGRYYNMLIGGLSTPRYGRQTLTIFEANSAQNLPTFALIQKKSLSSLYGLGKNKLIGLENDLNLLIYENYQNQENSAQQYLKDKNLQQLFEQLPGLNSLIVHQNTIRLHHEGVETSPEKLKQFANFLIKLNE